MIRHNPTIAISNRMFQDVADLIAYGRKSNCLAIDYSFPFLAQTHEDIANERESIQSLLKHDFTIRYHTPFFHQEIASVDPAKASHAMRLQKKCIDLAASLGGTFITVHIGLGMKSEQDLDFAAAIANLSDLVEYGAKKGLTVCLENLTKGFTIDPLRFLDLVKKSGATATFDLGHANACPWVTDGRGSSVDFLNHVIAHVRNAHVYEIERTDPDTGLGYHVAPKNLSRIGPLLAELQGSGCDWWLIELKKPEEVDLSLSLIRGFLGRNDA